MTLIFILIPVFSAFLGWLIIKSTSFLLFWPVHPFRFGSFSMHGYIYKNEELIKEQLVAMILKEVPAWEESAIKLVTSANLDKIRPELNAHIDVFLKVKLKQSMPIIGSLIGDRTIGQLKALFMDELETLFPSVIESYMSHLKEDIDVDQLVREKVNSFPFENVHTFIKNNFSSTFTKLSMLAAFIGFIAGCIESVIIYLLLP